MKLRHKLFKLTRGNTYRRAWIRCRAAIYPLTWKKLIDEIDQQKVSELRERYGDRPHPYPSKYLDVPRWMKWNALRVQRLNLHRSPPQRILDLGCGAGYFGFICQSFGHTCVGLDTGEHALYSEMCALLSVERVLWRIEAFQALPELGGAFDWITAFSISFNGHRTSRVWGPKEWKFLLDDLRRKLTRSGRIFLALNPEPGNQFYSAELREFFVREGGTIDNEYILLPAATPKQPLARTKNV